MRISDWSSDVCSSDLIGKQGLTFGVAKIDGEATLVSVGRQKEKSVSRDRLADTPSFLAAIDALDLHHIRAKIPQQLSAKRRSEEHTSELQSLMRISYAVFCLKKKNKQKKPATD